MSACLALVVFLSQLHKFGIHHSLALKNLSQLLHSDVTNYSQSVHLSASTNEC